MGKWQADARVLHVDDMADASIYVMDLEKSVWESQTNPMLSHINVGTGTDCSIKDLARIIADVIGYTGLITFDSTKPDGTPRKLLDVSRLRNLGWNHRIGLEEGLSLTYKWFVDNQDNFRG